MPVPVPLFPPHFNARTPTPTKGRNRRSVTVPPTAMPLVKLFFTVMSQQGVKYWEVEEATSVQRATMKAWRKKNQPGISTLTAAFNYLGWDLVPTPRLEALTPQLAADLVAIARRAELDIPSVWNEALNTAIEQRLVSMSIAERRTIIEAHSERQTTRPSLKRACQPKLTLN